MQKSPVHPLEPVNCNNPLWSWLLDNQGLWLPASPGLAWTLVMVPGVGCQPLVRLRGPACVQEMPEPSWFRHQLLGHCCVASLIQQP